MLSRLPLFSLRKSDTIVSSVRCASHWNKDWKAGPYPKTEEERLAAAKKYNLLPEEYEPYPDDGWGYGDYPKLNHTSALNRDHWRAWTNPEDRRDYGEPVLIYESVLSEDRAEWPYTDPGLWVSPPHGPLPWGIPYWKQLAYCLGMIGGFFTMFIVADEVNFIHFKPRCARHIPGEGKVHYSYSHRHDDHH